MSMKKTTIFLIILLVISFIVKGQDTIVSNLSQDESKLKISGELLTDERILFKDKNDWAWNENRLTLKFDKKGLIPAIIQDYKNGEVLMIAYMNQESLRRTIKLNKTCFWSRSRKEYWLKGETSGHFQFVKSIFYDCDMDALLIKVRQVGAACHTGNRSCFY